MKSAKKHFINIRTGQQNQITRYWHWECSRFHIQWEMLSSAAARWCALNYFCMSAEVIGTEESTVSDCGYADNTGSQEQFIVVCGLSWTLLAKGKTQNINRITLYVTFRLFLVLHLNISHCIKWQSSSCCSVNTVVFDTNVVLFFFLREAFGFSLGNYVMFQFVGSSFLCISQRLADWQLWRAAECVNCRRGRMQASGYKCTQHTILTIYKEWDIQMFYEGGNAFNTFVRPWGNTRLVLVRNTACITFVCCREKAPQATFK